MTDDTQVSLLLLAAEQDIVTQLTSDDIIARLVKSHPSLFTILVLVETKSHYCFSSLSTSHNSAFYFSLVANPWCYMFIVYCGK